MSAATIAELKVRTGIGDIQVWPLSVTITNAAPPLKGGLAIKRFSGAAVGSRMRGGIDRRR